MRTTKQLRIVLADRGDPVVGPMATAMRERYDVVARLESDLSASERLLVAAGTFRPDRRAWSERFFKSNLAVGLRTRRVQRGLADLAQADQRADVVFQTHGLFEITDPRTVLYLDCTHRQAMEQWPAWNPMRGRSLDRWLARERRQVHRAAHVFAFGAETARSLVEHYDLPADRVSVVGAGVNFDRLPPARSMVLAPASESPTVLFVGNDFERKGGPSLLEAFALLRRRLPHARLQIVGTPTALPDRDGVEHLGRVRDRAAMSRLYAEADVFCLPARFDPFPGALLEAMAHELPCVVTPSCGIPEIVRPGVTAVVVDHADPTRPGRHVIDLADALEHLLRDHAGARRMGLAGRRRVEDRFTWSHVLDRMDPVLQHLAERAGPASACPTLTTTSRSERP